VMLAGIVVRCSNGPGIPEVLLLNVPKAAGTAR